MAELELVGLHADGEHLVLAGPDGHRHRLAVDDALRGALRHDRPRLDRVQTSGELRPREIQTRLRAGESSEEIADAAGVTVDHVRRYEGPVVAERSWVAQQARAITLGRDSDAPTLGDLVVDRLASRGVQPEALQWSAARRPGEGWEVLLRFHAAERERVARWRVDVQNRSLQALDDESRWLSEVELGAPHARPRLAPDHPAHGYDDDHTRLDDHTRVYDIEVDPAEGLAAVDVGSAHPALRHARARERARDLPARPPQVRADTHDILEGLRATRGVRQEIAVLTEPETAAEDDLWSDPPPAHPPASAPHERLDASVLPLHATDASTTGSSEPVVEEPIEPARDDPPAEGRAPSSGTTSGGETPRRPRSRSRRTSVPSWDEIVFGAKQE